MKGEWIKGSMERRKNKKNKNNIIFMTGECIKGSMEGRKDKKKRK
jgi:hypothetical protein